MGERVDDNDVLRAHKSRDRAQHAEVPVVEYDGGRLAAELVNESKPPGSYDYIFDASAYSSGAYTYVFEAGDHMEVKTMLLVK